MKRRSDIPTLLLVTLVLYGVANPNPTKAAQASSIPSASAGAVPPFGQDLTYQGELAFGGVPVNEGCDFRIEVWDAAAGGSEVDAGTDPGVEVANGRFTARVLCTDESCYDGNPRWLEIQVRCPAGSGAFTTLTPRQEVTPAPYAVMAAEVLPGSVTSGEIADGTIQPEDVAGGVLYSRKNQLYRQEVAQTVSSAGTHRVSTSCNDANDLAVAGGCYHIPISSQSVRLTGVSHVGWEHEVVPAAVDCTYFNTIPSLANDIVAQILCLAVP